MLRRLCNLILCFCLLGAVLLTVRAEEQTARDITASADISGGGFEEIAFLTDGDETYFQSTSQALSLVCGEGMGGVYLVFDQPCTYLLRDPASGTLVTREAVFLHEYVNLTELFDTPPEKVVLGFPQGASLCEIRVYSTGEVPADVQQWSAPLDGRADIVLFSTHGDDEQLYFAGLLPYYAAERGLAVQVVYMTGHENLCGSERKHEMLNGLWAVGVRAYPVFGPFPDFKLEDREETYAEYENRGFNRADLLRFVVGNLRRFRPQVAIGHDLNGEYGHGMHRVYADLLTQAVLISADDEAFPEQVELYGTWDVPKTYLHLYPENPVVMDWDQPLEAFDGLTAFQVTQKLGFPCHKSQQYTLYTHWLYGERHQIKRAAAITEWSPCDFGLYRSTVGADVAKNDFMEHLTPYPPPEPEAQEPALQTALPQSIPQPPSALPPVTQPASTAAAAPAAAGHTNSTAAAAAAIMALSAAAFALLIRRKKFFEK